MDDHTRTREIFRQLEALRDNWYPTVLSHYEGQPFKALVAGMLSTRTREEQTTAACQRLFALADSPAALLRLPDDTIQAAIRGVSYHENKVRYLRGACERIVANGGQVPETLDGLTALPGVGWKVATLTLIMAFGQTDHVCVDVHVDRVGKRLGLVNPSTHKPERISEELKAALPHDLWASWNPLMVQFGREVCQPRFPRCRACPIRDLCPRVGVDRA